MGMPMGWQWIVILVVVLILFGGKKIPELAKGLGSGIKNFKKAVKEDGEELEVVEEEEEKPKVTKKVASAKSSAKKTTTKKTTTKKA